MLHRASFVRTSRTVVGPNDRLPAPTKAIFTEFFDIGFWEDYDEFVANVRISWLEHFLWIAIECF